MVKYAKLSTYKVKKILKCFCEDLTATQTSKILDLNRNTINHYFNLFRQLIFNYQSKLIHEFTGEVELDESYFGARRVRGKRGRGAYGKVPVFGILKRGGKVYTQILETVSKRELYGIIEGKIPKTSTVFTDCWRSYDGLVFNGYKHYRIKHRYNQFANGKNHINGIENFWSFAKRRLSKFNGINRNNFNLHLKECEFRYNEKKLMFDKLLNLFQSC